MLTRRYLLAAIPAVGVLGTLPARAGRTCRSEAEDGVRICQAGFDIGPFETARQECDLWCWAACIQAIFDFNGRHVEQEDIALQLFGTTECQAASGEQIVRVINRATWIDNQGFDFRAEAETLEDVFLGVHRPDMAREVVSELDNSNALICGALGHATVVTDCTYLEKNGTPVELREFQIRDPWRDSANKRVLGADEFSNRIFMCKVWVG